MTRKAPQPIALFRHWRRKRAAAATDAADMGTAYGMELSLDSEPAPERLFRHPVMATTVAPTAASRPVGWVRRLTSVKRSRG